MKGKAVYSLCFLLYVISACNQNIFTYHRDQKTIYLYSYQTQALTQGGALGLPLPEKPSALARTVYARTHVTLVHVTLPGLLKKRFAHGLRLLDEKPCSGVRHWPVGGYGGLPLAFVQHSFVGLAAARSHKGALVHRRWIPLVFRKGARSFNSLKVCFPPFGSVRRHDCAKLFLVVP